MNENLADLVKQSTEEEVQEQPIEESKSEEQVEIKEDTETVSFISLYDWFNKYHKYFDDINPVQVRIKGIEPDENLIVTIPDPADKEHKKIKMFEDANKIPVINMPATHFNIYNNGFRLVYDLGPNSILKCYGVKTGLIISSCVMVGGFIIPYSIDKVKKRDTEFQVKLRDPAELEQKLNQPADVEAIQILYGQIKKFVKDIKTINDALTWFKLRQEEVMDVNHHLKIDEVLIHITK